MTFGDRSYDLWYDCMTQNGGYHCKDASNSGRQGICQE